MSRKSHRRGTPTLPRASVPSASATSAGDDEHHWQQGRRAFLNGHYAVAWKAWSHCQRPQARPAMAEAHFRLALAAGDARAAAAELAAALAWAPEDARLHAHQARLLWQAGDLPGARAAAGRAAALAPESGRYRDLADLLAALAGEQVASAGGWRVALLQACVGSGDNLPQPPHGAPAWARDLVATMGALAGGDWDGALAGVQRGLGQADAPPLVREAFRHYGTVAAAGAGGWDAVVAAAPVGGPFAARDAAIRRRAAAEVLLAAARGDGEPGAVEAALALAKSGGWLPSRVRDRLAVAVGALHAARGDWAAAVRHWQPVAARSDLTQPLALAHERTGDWEAAMPLWEKFARRARPAAAAVAVYDHLAEAQEREGEFEAAARFAELALQQMPAPEAARRLALARLLMDSEPLPAARWEKAALQLEQVVGSEPRHAEAWACLADLRGGQGRTLEAHRAACRAWSLQPGAEGRLAALAEDLGRAVMDALQRNRLPDEAEALVADGLALATWDRHGAVPLIAALTTTIANHLQGRRQAPTSLGPREAVFRQPPGEVAPPSVFALRGLVALLAGRDRRASDLFWQVARAPCWESHAAGTSARQAWYLRWMAHCRCWTRQLRLGQVAPAGCAQAPECTAMQTMLTGAGLLDPRPAALPPCVAGCPQAGRLAAAAAREARATRKRSQRLVRRLDLLGLEPEELLGGLAGEEDGPW